MPDRTPTNIYLLPSGIKVNYEHFDSWGLQGSHEAMYPYCRLVQANHFLHATECFLLLEYFLIGYDAAERKSKLVHLSHTLKI